MNTRADVTQRNALRIRGTGDVHGMLRVDPKLVLEDLREVEDDRSVSWVEVGGGFHHRSWTNPAGDPTKNHETAAFPLGLRVAALHGSTGERCQNDCGVDEIFQCEIRWRISWRIVGHGQNLRPK